MLKIRLDKVIYRFGEEALLTLNFENSSDELFRGKLYIELEIDGELKMAFLIDEKIEVEPGNIYRKNLKIPLPREEGIGKLTVHFENNTSKISKDIELGIVNPSKRKPLMVAFVWHHHQAPNFYPDGVFHSLWAFVHVFDNEFPPHEGGAYYLHIKNHERHPEIKDCDHLSPSLLLQWDLAIKKGIRHVSGYINPGHDDVKKIRYVLDNFRNMASEGRIEILGDLFAHTVQGLVIKIFSRYGMKNLALKILDWELSYGRRITEKILGYKPIGVWTPEMYWSSELIELYSRNGYKYTVLCDQHFYASSGEKGSIYEPYKIEENGRSIIVFFRDRELSDWISFRNNFQDEEHADREARAFTLALLRRYFKYPGGICVIALDGENWMIFSRTRSYIPVFFDNLWKYIEESKDILKTITLADYLKQHDSNSFRQLKYIPSGSWIYLSDAQWTGGVKDDLWNFVVEKAKWVAALDNAIPDWIKKEMLFDEKSPLFQAYRALSIALDSDYFWYGDRELERKVIKIWAEEAEKVAREVLKKLKVQSIHISTGRVSIIVKNDYHYALNLWLILENTGRIEKVKILVNEKSTREIALDIEGNIRCLSLAVPPIVLKRITLHDGIFL
ncbi:MAG: hypothetical protein DRJ38_05130 [Thermoprotei archaeon]|nr:MAG: hypothetical protein DRJ38_05130 [Thermoprotei archaeon]